MKMTFAAPCMFGLESLVSDELKRLGLENVSGRNGRVLFSGGADAAARANISLRCAERVLLLCGEFPASTFDELFDGVRAIPWEEYLPRDAAFPVRGHCVDSLLASVPACRSIIKKAAAERLGRAYRTERLSESGAAHLIRFSIMKNRASVYLDTSGDSLHKRGYRPMSNAAPLRETLAAGMALLSRYRGRGAFYDPFCGSGTIAVEAALIAKNRAPGLKRRFSSEDWPIFPSSVWKEERSAAVSREFSGEYQIFGSDIDPGCVRLARSCAEAAGVSDAVRFEAADAGKLSLPGEGEGCTVVTNPPYGERMLDASDAERLYRSFGRVMAGFPRASLYLLSANPEFERISGLRADKKRNLYNGMIKCELFMYFNGLKPNVRGGARPGITGAGG